MSHAVHVHGWWLVHVGIHPVSYKGWNSNSLYFLEGQITLDVVDVIRPIEQGTDEAVHHHTLMALKPVKNNNTFYGSDSSAGRKCGWSF